MNNVMIVLLVLFIFFNLVFVLAQYKKNNGIIDIAWGLSFNVISITSLFVTYKSLRLILISFLVMLWGFRLTYHLFKRNYNKKEDYRYAEMRNNWRKYFYLRSYFQIYVLQFLLSFIIGIPILIVAFNYQSKINFLDIFGLLIWIIGYLFEVIGDYQLKKFVSDPKNKGHLMKEGLWQYTRHPNYFGESMMWWGIFVISLSSPDGYFGIISPILITVLLIYFTGVPLLEKKYQNHPEWKEYASNTSKFVPIFFKKR